MICQRIGLPPISTMGLGRDTVSSEILVPRPPARMTAFIILIFPFLPTILSSDEFRDTLAGDRSRPGDSPAKRRREREPDVAQPYHVDAHRLSVEPERPVGNRVALKACL